MNDSRKKVALIYGGRGAEGRVSEMGAQMMREYIDRSFDRFDILIKRDGRWLHEGKRTVFPTNLRGRGGFFLPEISEFVPVDCAFPLLHGDFGEDGVVQGALDCADIPYLGCDGRVGAICRNKGVVKMIAERLEIPTLPYITARRGRDTVKRAENLIGYPMFVKPTTLGSSIGCSCVGNRSELKEALKSAFALCNEVIIEKLLTPKRELECGYFATKGKQLFTNAGEIITNGEFYDYDKKYKCDKTQVIVRADLPSGINKKIKEYSKRLINHLGVRQISRIDFFLSGERIYFNEINTMPGMTVDSLYPKMLEASGICPEKFIKMLVEDGVSVG